jgi:uncharacterized protein (DUF924 family)
MSAQDLPTTGTPAAKQWVDEVLNFWFQELSPADWFKKDARLDEQIRERFSALYAMLKSTPFVPAGLDAPSLIASVIVLDQFPRNMFRQSAETYATDAKALDLAKYAVANGMDLTLTPRQRYFLYMPFMHSEDRAAQAESLRLFTQMNDADGMKWASHHKEIVDRFGRFPHRNAILGRESTAEEIEFVKQEPAVT